MKNCYLLQVLVQGLLCRKGENLIEVRIGNGVIVVRIWGNLMETMNKKISSPFALNLSLNMECWDWKLLYISPGITWSLNFLSSANQLYHILSFPSNWLAWGFGSCGVDVVPILSVAIPSSPGIA